MKRVLTAWLSGIFLLLIVLQTGSATFHLLEVDPCQEVKLTCKEHMHYSESEEICKICLHQYLLQEAYILPEQQATTPTLFVVPVASDLFIPGAPLLKRNLVNSLRGPPNFG